MEILQSGSNIVTVRENNLAVVIRLLHKSKVCTRSYLAKHTGLKQATITNIVNDLMEWGLVYEVGHVPGESRRSVGLSLCRDRYRTIGVRLNRNYVIAGLFDIAGTLLCRKEYHFDPHPDPLDISESMAKLVSELSSSCKKEDLLGVGVAIPGPFVHKDEKIALMSGFPGWENVNIKQALEDCVSCPVLLEHDANCGALSELWYGDIGDNENILFVAADIGVGAGLLINKRLYSGSLGIAGEIGHISIDYAGPACECGNRGCLELYCSMNTMLEDYKQECLMNRDYQRMKSADIDSILKDVSQGDPLARKVFARIATFLGIGLASAVNAYDPEQIILSDRIALAGDYLLEVVGQTLKERLLPQVWSNLKLQLGTFAQDSMLFGASALALENTLKQPTVFYKP